MEQALMDALMMLNSGLVLIVCGIVLMVKAVSILD